MSLNVRFTPESGHFWKLRKRSAFDPKQTFAECLTASSRYLTISRPDAQIGGQSPGLVRRDRSGPRVSRQHRELFRRLGDQLFLVQAKVASELEFMESDKVYLSIRPDRARMVV